MGKRNRRSRFVRRGGWILAYRRRPPSPGPRLRRLAFVPMRTSPAIRMVVWSRWERGAVADVRSIASERNVRSLLYHLEAVRGSSSQWRRERSGRALLDGCERPGGSPSGRGRTLSDPRSNELARASGSGWVRRGRKPVVERVVPHGGNTGWNPSPASCPPVRADSPRHGGVPDGVAPGPTRQP